jgi:paraquat-inducible protein A
VKTTSFRRAEALDLWAMLDVFLIGCAIGYSRLTPFANVTIRAGGWCFIGAALMAMLTRATLQRRRIWQHIKAPPAASDAVAFACNACGLAWSPGSAG